MTGHGGVNLVQLRSSVPPLAPRHDQVDESTPPQAPVTFQELVPILQANSVELSQEPLMAQAGLDFAQLVASDHQLTPRHDQVDDPPQEPGRFAVVVPRVQAYCTALLQVQLIGHGELGLVQVRSSVPPFVPRHNQVDDPPHDPARFPELVPVAQAN